MSETLPSYSFLPWLRQGLANNILTGDPEMTSDTGTTTPVILRASIPIELKIESTGLDGEVKPETLPKKNVALFGPGDIIGIDSKVIVKTEPHNWITNFEPNYLPYIDFYEEDFPWRYTPAHPDTASDHLRPWLTLVVLKEDEFEDGADIKDKPLPYFTLKSGKTTTAIFPKPTELWAWAHVHVNTDLSKGGVAGMPDAASVNTEITNLINQTPDQAYSRIICPRKLENNMGYHAFLIPTFESGRLAGLGLPFPVDSSQKVTLSATKSAWSDVTNNSFPHYYRWYFKTGTVGDFEYLVNLLQPKPADKTVGVRDIDVCHPGSNLPVIDDLNAHGDSILGGVLKLGGALKVPYATLKPEDKAEADKYENWDEPYPHVFNTAMARRINLAAEYVNPKKEVHVANIEAGIKFPYNSQIGDPDPVITLPLYGRWHALQKRLLFEENSQTLQSNNKNWIHELNLDPRYRISAGLGTKVVQKNQEVYAQAAWEQVGDIVAANNKIRLAQMAKEVSSSLYAKHLLPLNTERAFVFTAPVQSRIMYGAQSVQTQVRESVVPPAILSGTFRSITRPGGRMMKNVNFTDSIHAGNLVTRINEGQVVIAPGRKDPEGAINLTDIAEGAKPKDIPHFVKEALKKCTWFNLLPPLILELLKVFFHFNKWVKEITQAEALYQESQTPEAVDSYPKSPDFVISSPGDPFTSSAGTTDSEEAIRFKNALRDAFTLVAMKFPEPEKTALPLTAMTVEIVKALNPALTITKRTWAAVKIPGHISANMVESFSPVWVYPVIDLPMYKPLADMSSEFFLPNINLIEQNSITLLENNQKFIEAYMVGINHEMSRELLWREYPTDQRGSYFRQFWDISSFLPAQPAPENVREFLRDIPPIDKWSKTDNSKVNESVANSPLKNELGQHNQRSLSGGKTQLVLVIRGELLKKYPSAVIYAHKADWGLTQGNKDIKEERILTLLSEAEEKSPPPGKLKTPIFQAKIEPDIYFLGFDLDKEDAIGTLHPRSTSDDPGWFFVMKERPGEPRFGFDIVKSTRIINWNNLSWPDITTKDGQCINLAASPSFTVAGFQTYSSSLDEENKAEADDTQARWNAMATSAELAYILYQPPVLVAVHASRML